jgi:hypothetical protein
MNWLSVVSPIVERVLDFIPNPAEKAKAQMEIQNQLMQAAIAESQGQLEINKNEAANPNLFVSGWRPAIGWVCVFGFSWQFIVTPIALWVMALSGSSVPLPDIDTQSLYSLTMGMLGMGALRSFEKWKGITK